MHFAMLVMENTHSTLFYNDLNSYKFHVYFPEREEQMHSHLFPLSLCCSSLQK